MKSIDSAVKEKLAAKSGKNKEEIEQMINAKKEKFSGLLTETGAAIMVAKELGIDVEEQIKEETRLCDLKEGMNNIDVMARVKIIYPEKEFERNGKKGKLKNIILTDGTAEIRATLWHKDIDKAEQLGVKKGAAVKLSNCAISSYNGALQLSLNYNSSIALAENLNLPELISKIIPITDIEHGMNDVNIRAAIKKIFPIREFENERGKGKVMNFIITEGVNEAKATAWNEVCDEVEEIGEGEKIKIEGAYAKEGRDGVELHLGRSTRIAKEE